jgi:hypothetical protein
MVKAIYDKTLKVITRGRPVEPPLEVSETDGLHAATGCGAARVPRRDRRFPLRAWSQAAELDQCSQARDRLSRPGGVSLSRSLSPFAARHSRERGTARSAGVGTSKDLTELHERTAYQLVGAHLAWAGRRLGGKAYPATWYVGMAPALSHRPRPSRDGDCDAAAEDHRGEDGNATTDDSAMALTFGTA